MLVCGCVCVCRVKGVFGKYSCLVIVLFINLGLYLWWYDGGKICACVSVYVCMYVMVYVCMDVCNVCMYECNVCMYVMYACKVCNVCINVCM